MFTTLDDLGSGVESVAFDKDDRAWSGRNGAEGGVVHRQSGNDEHTVGGASALDSFVEPASKRTLAKFHCEEPTLLLDN